MAVVVVALHRRRLKAAEQAWQADSPASSGACTPTAAAEPPRAGPEDTGFVDMPPEQLDLENLENLEVLSGEHHRAPVGGEMSPEEQAVLDEGLMALGMLSRPGQAVSAAGGHQRQGAALDPSEYPDAQRHVAPRPVADPSRPYLEEGVDGADECFVMERVSPEEEERRYFANLSGGGGFDLFDGIAEPQAAPKRRPVVGYEEAD